MEEYGLEGVDWDKLDGNWSDSCDSDYLKGLEDIDWDEDWSEISDNCGGPDSICCVLQANRPSIETPNSTSSSTPRRRCSRKRSCCTPGSATPDGNDPSPITSSTTPCRSKRLAAM